MLRSYYRFRCWSGAFLWQDVRNEIIQGWQIVKNTAKKCTTIIRYPHYFATVWNPVQSTNDSGQIQRFHDQQTFYSPSELIHSKRIQLLCWSTSFQPVFNGFWATVTFLNLVSKLTVWADSLEKFSGLQNSHWEEQPLLGVILNLVQHDLH